MQNKENIHQFEIDMVKEFVLRRIEALSNEISNENLSGQFSHLASYAPSNGDGGFGSMMGGFIFDMFIWDALFTMADAGLNSAGFIEGDFFSSTFNTVAVASFEAYSLMTDTDIDNARARGVFAYYPKGRRKPKMVVDPKLAKNFNRGAANQNFAGADRAAAELNVMIDVMRKLEGLSAFKVRQIAIEKGESIYGAITDLHKKATKRGGMDLMFGGLRMAI